MNPNPRGAHGWPTPGRCGASRGGLNPQPPSHLPRALHPETARGHILTSAPGSRGAPVPWFLWTSRLDPLFSSLAPTPSALSLWLVTLVLCVPPSYRFLSIRALSASYAHQTGTPLGSLPAHDDHPPLCAPDGTAGLAVTTCSPCTRPAWQGPRPDPGRPQPAFGPYPHPGSQRHFTPSAARWARACFDGLSLVTGSKPRVTVLLFPVRQGVRTVLDGDLLQGGN